jgi:hypothetical protein
MQAQKGIPGALNYDANIAQLEGFRNTIEGQQDQQAEEIRNKARAVKLQQLQDANKFAEEQKKLQQQLVQQWRQQLAEEKADNDTTLAQEAQFWVRRMQTARVGSLSYKAALEEANKDIAHMREENMKATTLEPGNVRESYLPGALDQSRRENPAFEEQGREAADYLKNLNQGVTLQRENAAALEEAQIAMGLASGQLTRLDAAQIQARIHAEEYADAQKRLQQAMDAAAADPAMTAIERANALSGLRNQQSQIGGQYAAQQVKDQEAIASQQLGPAIHQALNEMVNSFNDMSASLKAVITRTMDSLNDNIVKAMTGQKTDFGKVFLEAGQGLLKSSLQKAEGMALNKLGLGGMMKADGSAAAPFYVKFAGGMGGIGAVAGSDPGAAGGGLLGGMFKFIQPFIQGHFASGGDVLAGYPAIVGEHGPELFTPRSAGSIAPAGSFGGTTHQYIINAQGATDPMAIQAAVQRALPHAVAASMQADHQHGMRTPQGR